MDLHELIEHVTDSASFLAFVQALADDRAQAAAQERERPPGPYDSGANGWDNVTVEDFLGAAVQWAIDMGARRGLTDEPTWKGFARFLYCGKIYE